MSSSLPTPAAATSSTNVSASASFVSVFPPVPSALDDYCKSLRWNKDFEADAGPGQVSICALPANVSDPLLDNTTTSCCNEVGGKLWTNNHDSADDRKHGCTHLPPTVYCMVKGSWNNLESCLMNRTRHTAAHDMSSCLSIPPRSGATGSKSVGLAMGLLVVLGALSVLSQ